MANDLRRYARQTQIRLVIGFLILIIIVGAGLIWYFYGRGAMLVGLLCIAGALVPVVAVVVALWGMEVVVKHANRD